jgi:hypothetical protein
VDVLEDKSGTVGKLHGETADGAKLIEVPQGHNDASTVDLENRKIASVLAIDSNRYLDRNGYFLVVRVVDAIDLPPVCGGSKGSAYMAARRCWAEAIIRIEAGRRHECHKLRISGHGGKDKQR